MIEGFSTFDCLIAEVKMNKNYGYEEADPTFDCLIAEVKMG
ncbi:MAG TPA: hypothetical protein VK021_07275 [Flavobacteriaceae bacterium]|nr:hypothetical protein [Flavobacteriaceae bacterium]